VSIKQTLRTAEEVVEYTREDFTRAGRRYDLLVD
jgi:hypothetical protein